MLPPGGRSGLSRLTIPAFKHPMLPFARVLFPPISLALAFHTCFSTIVIMETAVPIPATTNNGTPQDGICAFIHRRKYVAGGTSGRLTSMSIIISSSFLPSIVISRIFPSLSLMRLRPASSSPTVCTWRPWCIGLYGICGLTGPYLRYGF
jgi:hypothetical protein